MEAVLAKLDIHRASHRRLSSNGEPEKNRVIEDIDRERRCIQRSLNSRVSSSEAICSISDCTLRANKVRA